LAPLSGEALMPWKSWSRSPAPRKWATRSTSMRRDNQQWMLDWMVKITGRTHNFAYDHREIPPAL
jgi:hypothetical protein